MGFGLRLSPGRWHACRWTLPGLLGWLLAGSLAFGASGDSPDYPTYLARHQADLAPFFTAHGAAMFKDGLHILIGTAGDILLVTALFGWAFDIALAWGFSTIFSPAYAKFPRALIYASGRLVLALLLTTALTFIAMLGVNAGAGLPALTIVAVLTIPAMFIQVFWVGHLYRTSAKPSVLFYFALLAMHAVIFAVLVPTVFSRQVTVALTRFQDECVVPVLRTEAESTRHEAATLVQARDSAHAQVNALSARLEQDRAQVTELQSQIEADKNSPAVQYSRLVILRAQGDWADAGKGLATFIAQYPKDPQVDAARGELEAVNRALSAQLALQRQQEAQDAQAAAAARRALLADAAAGRATLSEMRSALLGQTTAQVAALFGKPNETGADKWGYGRRMVVDPQSGEHRGLTVVFSEGIVQGVDYYYGAAQ